MTGKPTCKSFLNLLAFLRSLQVRDFNGVGLRAKNDAWDVWSSPAPAADASHDQVGAHAPTQGDLITLRLRMTEATRFGLLDAFLASSPQLCDLGVRWDESFVSAASLVQVIFLSAHRKLLTATQGSAIPARTNPSAGRR